LSSEKSDVQEAGECSERTDMEFKIIKSYPEPDLERKWFDFMPNSNYPSHYTSPGFFKMPYWENQNPFAVLVLENESVVGVSCGLRNGVKVFSGMEVRPQISILKDGDEKEIAEFLSKGLVKAGDHIELVTLHSMDRIDAFEDLGFKVKEAEGGSRVVVLDLSKGAEKIFEEFSSSRRANIRKAMRREEILISQVETIDELEQLHMIHIDWCKAKGINPDTWDAFKIGWEQKDYKRIFIAKNKGDVIAGSYFRFYKNALIEYAANNSIPEYRRYRPNDLLIWKAIEWSCGKGFTKFNLGGSHAFLTRFGSEIVASYRYQLDLTPFQKHAKKEAIGDFVVKTYQSLPDSTRQRIKKVLKK